MSTIRIPSTGERATIGWQPTSQTLIRWCGAANVVAGILIIVANVLHPPRSFATLATDAQLPHWEPVHALGIVAFVVTVYALIGAYARQSEQAGLVGLIGFVAAVTGVVLGVGVLVPDSFVFPVLAEQESTRFLLSVPGTLIPGGSLGIYILLSGLLYTGGYILFGIATVKAGILPRAATISILIGVVPLTFGALLLQGLDVAGALLVGVGHIWWGYALWIE